ncbi:MAG: hypothetical protein WA989_16965 [Henriciella sp.]|uniref:hypothetical protein n=1 Tax=Henriciella sp. TaxID=1968823 RepID=UPI003C7188C2
MTDFSPGVDPQDSQTRQPDTLSRQILFDRFVRASGWLGLHLLLGVGYLTTVFSLGMNWLSALALFFVAGLVLGKLMGLSKAWIFAMIAQALVVLIAGSLAIIYTVLM